MPENNIVDALTRNVVNRLARHNPTLVEPPPVRPRAEAPSIRQLTPQASKPQESSRAQQPTHLQTGRIVDARA